jgi:hypothetical protein
MQEKLGQLLAQLEPASMTPLRLTSTARAGDTVSLPASRKEREADRAFCHLDASGC